MNRKQKTSRPSFQRKILAFTLALAIGGALSSLFTWDEKPVYEVFSVQDIFFHNIGLAAIVVLVGHYVAGAFFLVNMGYLGFALVGSLISAGAMQTMRLTIIHVPLEISAWLLFWVASEHMSEFYSKALQTLRVFELSSILNAIRFAGLGTALLLLAALAEWAELRLLLT